MCQFELPITDIRDALRVLNTKFDVNECPKAYVNFEEIRSIDQLQALLIQLNILDNLVDNNTDYAKILFTGHTGSGKTTELKKLEKYLNHKERYFTVFADVQDAFQISTFEQEDLYILLISKLVEALDSQKVPYDSTKLDRLATEWMQGDAEIAKEVKDGYTGQLGVEAEAGTSIGFMFWKLFSLKGTLKTAFSYESKTSTTVRQKIRANKGEYIQRLNEILIDIRHTIIKKELGQDIIFIIDGVERLRQDKYDVYVNTFFRDARLLQELNTNFICCVPIETRYDIHIASLITPLYKPFELPLLSISATSIPYFKQLITNRVNEARFFETGVLDYLVAQSGGHPRQLILLTEKALTYSITNKGTIKMEAAEKACAETGRLMRRLLNKKHIDLLHSGDFMNADTEILELLFSTALLEYNGTTNTRKINPVLQPFI
jgi:energy-coupling factor transporter ATP-binding protein EcfA2